MSFARGLLLARKSIESFGVMCARLGAWILENPIRAVKALCIIYGSVLCFLVWCYLLAAAPVAGCIVLAATLFGIANCIK
jgi:hypothetical protein